VGLDVEKKRILGAIRSFPPLAYQAPRRIINNVESGARALGVERAVLVEVVLRAPSLAVRRLDGWSKRMRMVLRIGQALGVELSPAEVLRKLPAAMTYGLPRLLQRYVVARRDLWSGSWGMLLICSDQKVRVRLAEYFREHPQRRTLRAALERRKLL
jgi:hypothetical protein